MTYLARGLLWLVLAAWLLLALSWAGLQWVIVPRIAEFRPEIESQASRMLGVSVRIGRIEAQADGLAATIELANVELLDAQGRQSLHLQKVMGVITPLSLWNMGFAHLAIESPQLDIRRATDGRLFVAGMDISASQDKEGKAAQWLFSQKELVIHGGTLVWTDQLHAVPALTLQQVDVVMRNGAIRHALRMDATPPPELGKRFTLMASFRESLLSKSRGQWQTWEGQLYAGFEHVDVAQLRRYAAPGMAPALGSGALRAWIDVKRGQITGSVADVALTRAQVSLNPRQPPLAMKTLSGRIGGRIWTGGFEVSTQGLQFVLDDGVRWTGGNLRYKHLYALEPGTVQGELQADALNLATLSRLAHRLPVGERVHDALKNYGPQGTVNRLLVKWQGPIEAPTSYEAKGSVSRLAISARAQSPQDVRTEENAEPPPRMLSPGVKGLDLDFDLTQSAGHATVRLQNGQLDLPGVFEQHLLDFTQLSAFMTWRKEGAGITLDIPRLSFSNADAQGEARLSWHNSQWFGDRSAGPGELDLVGSLSRADAAKIARYMPRAMAPKVRRYLQESVQQGRLSAVRFKLRGDLRAFPFTGGQGEFEIAARVEDAVYAYVPKSNRAESELQWPAFTAFNADLRVDRSRLQIKNVTAGLQGVDGLRFHQAEASIPDFMQRPVVTVSAQARGPLDGVLAAVMKRSPLAKMTGGVLAQAKAAGTAQYQFRLQLPLQDMAKTQVSGLVTLGANELQIGPRYPRLRAVQGVVHFSERGFALSAVRARALGGEVHAEGGTIHAPTSGGTGPAMLRVTGNATAEGLRQAHELGVVARLANRMSGGARYALTLGVRQGVPEFSFQSSLQGMALDWPEPLSKTAQETLNLRLKTALTDGASDRSAEGGLRDRITLQIGNLLSAVYDRKLADGQAQVLRGAVGVGLPPGEAVPLPDAGVVASVRMDSVDLDAWRELLADKQGGEAVAQEPAPAGGQRLQAYLPDGLVIQAKQLTLTGRKLNQVLVGGTREDGIWRANMEARELSGYVEYRQPSQAQSGQVYARLARLSLAAAEAREVESMLDEQPASIPALDIVINDMELRGKKLGRIEIEAVNRGADAGSADEPQREWRLSKLNVIMPEAVLTGTGNWAALNATGPTVAAQTGQRRRRTVMNFKLDIHDAGGLLARMGMDGVIRSGKGHMEGQIGWLGSPMTLDKQSLNGAFSINVEEGQFLKAEPGLAKLLGVLSLQSLPRRLTLDFRDVFSDGFSFDFVRGDVRIEQGVATSNNLQMKGVNAAVLMEGQADMVRETQNLKVVVVPEINAGTASLIATWINPAVGLGTFMAQLILRRPLIESATQTFLISGSWAEPKIVRPSEQAPPPSASEGNP